MILILGLYVCTMIIIVSYFSFFSIKLVVLRLTESLKEYFENL